MNIATALLAAVLLIGPFLCAVPEEQRWSPVLNVVALVAGALLLFARQPPPAAGRSAVESTVGDRNQTSVGDGDGRRATWAMLGLAGCAIVSVCVNALFPHPTPAFLGTMLSGCSTIVVWTVMFAGVRHLARLDRRAGYAIGIAAIAVATIIATIGLQEYVLHVRAGQSQWRVFATSTPDYLAAYLLMVAPATIAAACIVPRGNSARLLLALGAMMQAGAVLTTGSRFGILTLLLGAVLAAASLIVIRSSREHALAITKRQIAVGMGVLVLVAVVFGRPIVRRLMTSQGDSTAFRVWTWRGSLRMARAHWLAGTGPGTFGFAFPHYAVAGFTRAAHNGYLHLADEAGVFAALLAIAALILVVRQALEFLAGNRASTTSSQQLAQVQQVPEADRMAVAGIVAGLIGEAVQNLIDSDLQVYALGVTFWALAGLASGIASRASADTQPITETGSGNLDAKHSSESSAATPHVVRDGRLAAGRSAMPFIGVEPSPATGRKDVWLRGMTAVLLIGLALYNAANAVAAGYAASAQASLAESPPDGAAAQSAFSGAIQWAPLDGRYASDLGYLVDLVLLRDNASGMEELRRGIALQPDSNNYVRLGRAFESDGDAADAANAYRNAMLADPTRVDARLDEARVSPSSALQIYQGIADMERTPVGRVRAIAEIHDPMYAIADAAVADAALQAGNTVVAAGYYRRAKIDLEEYGHEDGSTSQERIAEVGHAQPDVDQQYLTLYDHVAEALIRVSPQTHAPIAQDQQITDGRFEWIIGTACQLTGDTDSARDAYNKAIEILSPLPGYLRDSTPLEASDDRHKVAGILRAARKALKSLQ